MPILAFDPVPAEIQAVLKRREELGLDHRDEVWDGVYHMIPPPSHARERVLLQLGGLLDRASEAAGLEATGGVGVGDDEHNYRVPDISLHRPGHAEQWHPTVALAVEIVSPHDTAWDKLAFYADHNVDELLYVDLEKHEVRWMVLNGGEYRHVERSGLIDLGASEVAAHLGWS